MVNITRTRMSQESRRLSAGILQLINPSQPPTPTPNLPPPLKNLKVYRFLDVFRGHRKEHQFGVGQVLNNTSKKSARGSITLLRKYMTSKSNYSNVDVATSFYKILFNRTRSIKANFTVWEKYFIYFQHTFVLKACAFFIHRNLVKKR